MPKYDLLAVIVSRILSGFRRRFVIVISYLRNCPLLACTVGIGYYDYLGTRQKKSLGNNRH